MKCSLCQALAQGGQDKDGHAGLQSLGRPEMAWFRKKKARPEYYVCRFCGTNWAFQSVTRGFPENRWLAG
jgi:hypothetical protein